MKYLTRFADKNTALEFTTGGGRVLKAPHVSKVGNDAVFSENIERGKSCIFVEESDGELKLVELIANNEIWYTSRDGSTVTPYKTSVFGSNIVSNTYENDKGVITFNRDVTSIGNQAFQSRYSLTSITIPNSVTSIGDDAFYYCSSLTSVTIPNSITRIGNRAFTNCSALTSVTIPNSVTSIGYEAFKSCKSLTSITIPNSVTSIGNSAFESCRGLTSITIPNSITSIGYQTFEYCSSLTSITIPNSVTSIGDLAFYGCTSLTSFTYEGTQTQWNSITKGSEWSVRIPATYVQCTDGQVTL